MGNVSVNLAEMYYIINNNEGKARVAKHRYLERKVSNHFPKRI